MIARLSRFALVLSLALLATPLVAAPPWARLALFKHLEADPQEAYPINENNGPWMIMAATFTGEGAMDQARELVYELRREYKLSAYTYQKEFDYTAPVEGKGLNPYGEAPKMRYRRDEDVVEIAVLVGDYPNVDDPEAQKVLKKLKYAEPESLKVKEGEETSQALATLRAFQKQIKKAALPAGSEDLKRGPMGGAFIITNPLMPHEYFVPKGIDRFVEKMNENVPHSLLACPGKYSVQVATFTGHAIIVDNKVQQATRSRRRAQELPRGSRQERPPAHRSAAQQRLRGLRISRSQLEPGDRGQLRLGGHAAHGRQDRDQSRRAQDHAHLRRRDEDRAGQAAAGRAAQEAWSDPLRRATDAGRSAPPRHLRRLRSSVHGPAALAERNPRR